MKLGNGNKLFWERVEHYKNIIVNAQYGYEQYIYIENNHVSYAIEACSIYKDICQFCYDAFDNNYLYYIEMFKYKKLEPNDLMKDII